MRRRVEAERILRRRSPLAIRFLSWQFRKQLARSFHAVRLSCSGALPDLPNVPVVIYSNHPSWWEAVTYVYLGGRLFPHRIGYGPVSARQLERYPFLDRLGIFGIDLDSYTGAARFLAVARELFRQPGATMWITAEGTFTDQRSRPVRLRPGISHLAALAEMVMFVPVALEYVFWNEKNPELLVRFGTPVRAEGVARRPLHTTLEAALTQAMDQLACESATRDPALFTMLLKGSEGVNPLYDIIRRALAFARGMPFEARHGA